MNKIIITNQGHILPEDLVLIGSSTKREDSNKIGMFGSGWKYALAWMLRNNVEIEIYSGTKKIDITKQPVKHRTNDVEVIVVNGKESSLTTDMGPKWTGWMALREVLSNAIDEGKHTIDVAWNPQIDLQEGVTKIVIPTNNELAEVMMCYENYFCFDRKTEYVYDFGRIFIKSNKTPMNVYRKGIKCYDDETRDSYFDVDFNSIEINESRLTGSSNISYHCREIVKAPNLHKEAFLAVLKTGSMAMLPSKPTDHIIYLLKDLHSSGYNYHCNAVLVLCGPEKIKENSISVPDKWYEILVEHGIAESIFTKSSGGENFFRTDLFDTGEIEYYLKGVNIKKNVQVGKFSNRYTEVHVDGDTAYISEGCKDSRLAAAKIILSMDTVDIASILQ